MKDLLHQSDVHQLVGDAYRSLVSAGAAGTQLYEQAQLPGLPDGAKEWSLGVGNPVAWARLSAGEDVLDIGSGGGIDTLLAAHAVGAQGSAIGVDFLPEMVERGMRHADQAGLANATFVQGEMEALPLPDGSVDVVVSNGVVNLSPRKTRVLYEIARVLRAGGRISLADIIIDEDLPTEILTHPSAWAG